ncbi:MAG: glycosyltransferase [Anaerolineales bacterium]|nr:glycosyltransferase [Anaerolineales bacterium]
MKSTQVPRSLFGSGWWIGATALIYVVDRALKLAAVAHFMGKPLPAAPATWPTVTLLQPITRGASNLTAALEARAAMHYPGAIQHVLICDRTDLESQAICQAWITRHPASTVELLLVNGASGSIASKIEKLNAGVKHAIGEVLCFIDDDIAPRPDTLALLVRYLETPGAGATFGVACYTNWDTHAASLMSAFVNANALTSYLPLTYVAEPYTITGHIFALHRTVFAGIGGLSGMAQRIDDDHELARRVRAHGLHCVQTPALYDVDNRLTGLSDYANQMRRWFVIPRQTMLPYLTAREQVISFLGSVGNLLLPLLALLAATMSLSRKGRSTRRAFLAAAGAFGVGYWLTERCYLQSRTPIERWPHLFIAAVVAPVQGILALMGRPEFKWRGQHLRLNRGGTFERVEPER